MITKHAAWHILKPPLIPDLSFVSENEKCLLTRDQDFFRVCVPIVMHIHQHGLLTQIASPVGLYLRSILILALSLFLSINVVFAGSLKGRIAISLDFQV